jgi:DNA-binding SARP family transcriptional activator
LANDTPSGKYSLALLGRFELTGPDGIVDMPGGKLAGLLAYLACTAPRPQSRDKLATLLWGSYFDTQAKQNLRQALARLRRILGDSLETDAEAVWLRAAAIDCDVSRFEMLVRDGSRDALSAAADLYHGRLIDDITVREEVWSEWVAAERERLSDLAVGALVQLGEQELTAGRAEHALKAGRRAIAFNNLREDAHRLVIQALVATGRKAEALRHYQDITTLLKRELNTEPDRATRSLVVELRRTPEESRTVRAAIEPVAAARDDLPSAAVRPIGSERRPLTIVSCHVVDAIVLSTRLDPDDMHELIGSFHKAVADTAASFDGFVAQYLSDGVLLYFGYPTAGEHDAEQAVRAGLAVRDAVSRLVAASGISPQARVGIATGLVVLGEPAVAGVGQSIAIGDVPTLAARLQAAAAPGEIVIGASTLRLVGQMFQCRPLPAVEMPGTAAPLEAWQVLAESAGVSRFEALRRGALLPLVGRHEEMDRLLSRWRQARGGEGQVVLISGESGIGKSRIAEDLRVGLEGEAMACLRYFCSPHGTNSPLHPVIGRLEAAAGFESADDVATKRGKLEALLRPTSRNASRDVALVAELLGLPSRDADPVLAASPQHKREMLLTALVEQIEGLAAQGPILVVFEDAHWIDPTTLDLADRLISRTAQLPLLLVGTFRPEFQPPWVGQPHVTVLLLNRLDRRDSARIMAGIAGDKALPDLVVERVVAQADGVPLFVEELTTALLESDLLRETADGYVMDEPLPPLAIPTTLQALLVARFDRLGPAKDVAQIGAAIGREFSYELVAAVSELDSTELELTFERLTASGLVTRRGAPPGATYSFKHALVQDAALATMLRSRRSDLHSRIARVLVERLSALAEGQPEIVARHFTEAGLAGEAIDYWVKAGRLALGRWANREAVEFFEQALAALASVPESPSTLKRAFDIRLQLPQALIQLRQVRQALERLQESETLAERLDDDRRRCRVLGFKTIVHTLFGELDEALQAGTRTLEIARRHGNLKLRIPATTILEQVHFYRGEHERVVALAVENLAALPADWDTEAFGLASPPSVYDRGRMIISLAELGRFAETTRLRTEAITLVAGSQHAYSIGWVHLAVSWPHLLQGDWAQASPSIEHATAVLRAGQVDVLLPLAVGLSAWSLAQLGETSEALNQLREGEQLLERHTASGLIGLQGWFYALLGRAAFVLGRLEDARRLGNITLEFSSRQPGFAAQAMHLLGEVATHPSCFDAKNGVAYYQKALALAQELRMRPLVAYCHFGFGKLRRRTGAPERAAGHFSTAATMFRDLDMPFWRERAEAARLDEET